MISVRISRTVRSETVVQAWSVTFHPRSGLRHVKHARAQVQLLPRGLTWMVRLTEIKCAKNGSPQSLFCSVAELDTQLCH